MLKHIWPWSVFDAWRAACDEWERAFDRELHKRFALMAEVRDLRSQLASYRRFDHDGNGKPGGSREEPAAPKANPGTARPDQYVVTYEHHTFERP